MIFKKGHTEKPIILLYQISWSSSAWFFFVSLAFVNLLIEAHIGTILKIYDGYKFIISLEANDRTFHKFSSFLFSTLLTAWVLFRCITLHVSLERTFTKPSENLVPKRHQSASKGTWRSVNEWSFSSYVFCNIKFWLTSLSSAFSSQSRGESESCLYVFWKAGKS